MPASAEAFRKPRREVASLVSSIKAPRTYITTKPNLHSSNSWILEFLPHDILLIMNSTLILLVTLAAPLAAATCDSLATLSLPATSVTRAALVPAGEFSLAPGTPPPQQQLFKRLPAFCRVAATLSPTSDSEIKIEVWLPAENWNAKFMVLAHGARSPALVYQ